MHVKFFYARWSNSLCKIEKQFYMDKYLNDCYMK